MPHLSLKPTFNMILSVGFRHGWNLVPLKKKFGLRLGWIPEWKSLIHFSPEWFISTARPNLYTAGCSDDTIHRCLWEWVKHPVWPPHEVGLQQVPDVHRRCTWGKRPRTNPSMNTLLFCKIWLWCLYKHFFVVDVSRFRINVAHEGTVHMCMLTRGLSE